MQLCNTCIYRGFAAFVVVAGVIWIAACELATIRPLDPVTGKAIIEDTSEVFLPSELAVEIWTGELAGLVQERGQEAGHLLSRIASDPAGVAEHAGHAEPGRAPNYLTFGNGIVTEVDTSSRAGVMAIDLEPQDDEPDLLIQIGPVIRGTALRDAIPSISFNQFENQLDYAAISRELHRLVVDSLLAGIEIDGLKGVEISFSGAFTYQEGGQVLVTPIQISREE